MPTGINDMKEEKQQLPEYMKELKKAKPLTLDTRFESIPFSTTIRELLSLKDNAPSYMKVENGEVVRDENYYIGWICDIVFNLVKEGKLTKDGVREVLSKLVVQHT